MHPISLFVAGLFTPTFLVPPQGTVDLKRAVSLAMENRSVVQAARLRVDQARFSRNGLAAPPSLRLDLGATSEPDLRGNDDDVVLAQPIDLFGRRPALRTLGEAQVALAEAELRRTLSEIQGEVVERYADAVAARQLEENAAASLALTERLGELTRLRVEGGAAPAVQLTRVGIEVERARQSLALRQAQRRAALKRLSAAIGSTVDAVGEYGAVPVTSVSRHELEMNRPDLITLGANLRISHANALVARTSGKPELEASARTNVWTPGDKVFGLRVQLSLPIFDYGRIRNEIRAADAQFAADKHAVFDAIDRATTELRAIQIEVEAAETQVASFEKLLAAARELVEKSQIGLREGAAAISLVDVLEAMRALREVEQDHIEARLRLAQAQAAHLRATGRLIVEMR